ncbi:TonB-dependent receptor [Sulfurimonas aquatica]|uniref:TonB-dependent receptor n=1 Tax=Sulfurimonas aquatica TaxID=2672570 RepID=A0A975GC50_9BACT|nr:TonB-dependent receptor [Sulfurimonas aquatica]QSZ40899.1 TonB-dependent receptor [Sulfurimonas aquatica]
MKKIIPLSLVALASLYATDVEVSPIGVESTLIMEVAQKAQTSADVAEALKDGVPSIDMSRRSGIANDILIRGQKRDNISIEVDGTKVYGACPNRMDPPVSHILANQITEVEVTEGPYDVTNFGTLSGGVKIKTKKPTAEEKASINVGFGSWGYKKFGATASGGNDIVRVLVTASTESANQYRDGDGNSIAEQMDNYAATNPAALNGIKLQAPYHDMEAYSKKSIMAKAFVTTAKNQELRLSVTANRSNNILYGNSKMDALYDDSNIYSVEYNVDALNDTYKNLNLQYYYSDVDHPMSIKYRMAATVMGTITSHLKTSMQGLKFKNTLDIASHEVLVGLDTSKRTWNGNYYKNDNRLPDTATTSSTSIDNAETTNMALFAKINKSYGDLDITLGARYDITRITNDSYQSNDYSAINANLLSTYNINNENKLFLGFGQSSRVPDARELYFVGSKANLTGTPTLEQTTNQEVDLGYEANADSFKFKAKAFYSMLSDYIYIKKNVPVNAFQNIDATIYGAELSASYYATDDITVDLGASYKKGEKSEALAGQSDTDLADMAPLRGNIALNYEYANNSIATIEVQASDKWSDIDSDNGEQELEAWSILNAKIKHAVNKDFDITLGVNNILDETYAQSNTYADLTLITDGTPSDIMLMNEPGRYVYTNLDFKF